MNKPTLQNPLATPSQEQVSLAPGFEDPFLCQRTFRPATNCPSKFQDRSKNPRSHETPQSFHATGPTAGLRPGSLFAHSLHSARDLDTRLVSLLEVHGLGFGLTVQGWSLFYGFSTALLCGPHRACKSLSGRCLFCTTPTHHNGDGRKLKCC